MKRHQLDGNLGNGGGIGGKAPGEAIKIGPSAGVELGVDCGGEFGLAGTLVGECQQPTMVRHACFSLLPASSASKAR